MNDMSTKRPGAKAGPNDFIPKEEYVSPEFATWERARLWPRVWQMACREEEIANVGDYVTYDIGNELIIVIRTAADQISAYHNACQHRGRRLTEGCGHAARLFCRFHGWSWKLDGSIERVVDRANWDGSLNDDDIKLPKVRVGAWGGWVFVNMDENAEPLLDFLSPIPQVFANYEFEKLRYRWYKSVTIDCNWKVALEAFDEGYHVQTTHRQLLPMHEDQSVASAQGRHGMYVLAPEGISFGARSARLDPVEVDFRKNVYDFIKMLERDLAAITPPRTVDAIDRLLTELPGGASHIDVLVKFGEISREAAEAEGAGFPSLTPEDIARAGVDWHVFPNMVFLPAPEGMLAYRARPDRADPEKCIFDIFSLVRYAPGDAPPLKREVFEDWRAHDNWGLILMQDFENMVEVQRGMRSSGFTMSRTNPIQERAVSNFHRALREFLGTRAPYVGERNG